VALEDVGFVGDGHDTNRRRQGREQRTLTSSACREVELRGRVGFENARSEHGCGEAGELATQRRLAKSARRRAKRPSFRGPELVEAPSQARLPVADAARELPFSPPNSKGSDGAVYGATQDRVHPTLPEALHARHATPKPNDFFF
jgi:hypothetical protein